MAWASCVETTAANQHDSKPLLTPLDKAEDRTGYSDSCGQSSLQKHREALKARGIKNGIQDKAVKNRPLTQRQLQRNSLISKARYVVERTFGSQARWFGAKVASVNWGKAKADAWHILQADGIQPKRLPRLYVNRVTHCNHREKYAF